MNDILLAVLGGLMGAIITGIVSYIIANRNTKKSYYNSLIKLIEQHNWNLKIHNLDSGLSVKNVDQNVSIVCYQHLNILFHVWLNKKIVKKDGTLEGWKNWAKEIVSSSKKTERKEFRDCYRQILVHGDIYPKIFLVWLDQELGISSKAFREVS
ncbi:hypothetical protein [Tenacibaculum agarivorans]|uniref:hypothetical protein n=1 Tax=Tenacibaculum agarivorans TaxID=1908389 RepID=UPI00094BAD7E|nr:hypothetical protein [Tenacibaculum agarivorans]